MVATSTSIRLNLARSPTASWSATSCKQPRRRWMRLRCGRSPSDIMRIARRLTATSRRARPRWRSHQRRARRCRLQRRRLGTMRTGANYSLWMVGRQARHGGPTCVQKYILSEAGGRGRRCCGVGREEDSDLPGFLFPKFFRKKFGQKIGAGPQWRIFGNGTCAGPVLLHPAPLSCR